MKLASTSLFAKQPPPPLDMVEVQTHKLLLMEMPVCAPTLQFFMGAKVPATGGWLTWDKHTTSEELSITTGETVANTA